MCAGSIAGFVKACRHRNRRGGEMRVIKEARGEMSDDFYYEVFNNHVRGAFFTESETWQLY